MSFIASIPWWGGRDGNSIDSSLTLIACSAAAIETSNGHPGMEMELSQEHGSGKGVSSLINWVSDLFSDLTGLVGGGVDFFAGE